MYNKSFVCVLLISLVIFLSCSQTNDSLFQISQTDTIRYATDELRSSISWTDEINPEILFNTESIISTNAAYYERPGLVYAGGTNRVYPILEGFSVLDTRDITTSIYNSLIVFLESIKNKDINNNFFIPGRPYLSILANFEFDGLPNITDWYIGKPFIVINDENPLYELPVRIIFSTGYKDIYLYLVNFQSDNLQIEQIVYGDYIHE